MVSQYIRSGERIDDLQINGLKLIQNPTGFCFGIDAVLLSQYASVSIKSGANVLDLCCGNGIIPILLTAKSEASYITGLEIQKDVAEMAQRSVNLNNLGSKVTIKCGDLKEAPGYFGKSIFDNITCNPPYKEAGGGLTCESDPVTIARHEVLCSLEDIIAAADAILKPGGKLCMIHRPERLIDIIWLMRKYGIEPKRLRFVHPNCGKTANLILIEGTRRGRPKLFLDKPLYIYEETGSYTKEIDDIYGRNTIGE